MLNKNRIEYLFIEDKIKAFHKEQEMDTLQQLHNHMKLNPNSIDVTLGNKLLFINHDVQVIDVFDHNSVSWREETIPEYGFTLWPNSFCLATVNERFECGNDIAQMYEGRSTIARIGLFTHICAGFGDVGFKGNFTLELYNASGKPIKIYPDIRIGQIGFVETSGLLVDEEMYMGAYRHQYGRPLPPVLGRERML